MSEIEKMYRTAKVVPSHHNCNDCQYDMSAECPIRCPDNVAVYPPFTAEKQLKILCFIVNNKHSVTFHDQIFSGDKLTLEKIQEDLVWAINRIWQDLTETEQEEIRKILKG